MAAASLLLLMPVLLNLADLALGYTFGQLRPPPVEWLTVVHATACLWAGISAGARVVNREVRDHTLWAIQLLSLAPGRVVWLKLWLPLYCIVLTWMAGIPFYVMAVLLESTRATGAGIALATAAWAGGIGLPLTLLSAGMLQGNETSGSKPRQDNTDALRGLSGLALGAGAIAVGCTLMAAPDRLPFFGLRVSAWPAAGLLLALTWAGAVTTCVDIFSGDNRDHPGLPWVCSIALVSVALGGVGAAWGRVPGWVGVAVALVLAVAAFAWIQHSKSGPTVPQRINEDPWSVVELDWIADRYDNPMLLRDLRAGIRGRSFRRTWLYQAIAAPFLVGILYLVVVKYRMGLSPFAWMMNGPLIHGLGTFASANWTKDRDNATLSLLKLCPLTARELLWGRMAASFSREAAPAILSIVLLLSALGWLIHKGFWITGPLALAFLPLFAVSSVWSACHTSAPEIPGSLCYGWLRSVALAGIPVGIAALFALRGAGPIPCFTLAAVVGTYNGWFATQLFSEYARRFELTRSLDQEPSGDQAAT